MSARVSRESSSVQPMVCQMPPEQEAAKPAAPQVCKATVDDVERFRAQENDGRAGKLGTALEQGLRTALGRIPDGAEAELEVKGAVTAEGLTGQASGKVGVERRGDAYLVTVDASLGAGIGKKGGHDSASLTGNLEGKVTLRYGSKEEAADNVAALMQVGAAANGPVGAIAIGAFGDDDLRPRALHALDKVQTVELSANLTAEVKLAKETPIEGMKAAFGGSLTATPLAVKLDFEKGEVVASSSVSGDARAMLEKEIGEASGVEGVTHGFEGTARLAVEGHYPMSREDLARIARDPRELQRILSDPSRHVTWEAEATLSGQSPGVEVTATKRGPAAEMMARFSHLDFTSGEDWHIEASRVVPGPAFEGDAGVAAFEVGSRLRFPTHESDGPVRALAHVLKEGQQHQAHESHLPAYRVLYSR